MLIHRVWGFTALNRSPHPEYLLCPTLAGDVMIQLNPPDRDLSPGVSSCFPSSLLPALLPTFLLPGAGTVGLAGKAEALIPFPWNLQPGAGSAPWTGAWWCQRRRSSENTDAVFQWCPNDWFHSSVQETVTESCWIMARQRSVCSESIQGLPGSQQGWLMNIAVNGLVLPVFTGGRSGCGRLPVCPWTHLLGTPLSPLTARHVHKWFAGSGTCVICLRSYRKTAGKMQSEVKVPAYSVYVQSMKILCFFLSRQCLLGSVFVQYSSSVIGAVTPIMQWKTEVNSSALHQVVFISKEYKKVKFNH